MAHLAQAYIHLKPYRISAEQLQLLGRATDILATEAAAGVYDFRIAVDVELAEGSLIGRVTILGTVVAVYAGIADYKGFKESTIEMVHDARYVGGLVIDGIKKLAQPAPREVYRTERRTKTPGKLYRIAQRLEQLDAGAEQLSERAILRELAEIREELDKVRRDLTPAERKVVLKALEFSNLPPIPEWPHKAPDVGPGRKAQRPTAELEFFDEDEEPVSQDHVFQVTSPKKPMYHNRIELEANDGIRFPKQLPDYEKRLQEIVEIATSTTSLTPLRTKRIRRRPGSAGTSLTVKP